MGPLLATSLISGGSKLLGGLIGGLGGSGGGAPTIPPWLIEMAKKQYEMDNYTGFLPDKQAYSASAQAAVDSVMSRLPISMESFNADLASRGIYGAGEAPKYMYRDVIAPVAQAATNAVAQSELEYARAYQSGSIQAAQMKQNAFNVLSGLVTGNVGLERENYGYEQSGRSQFFGELGNIFGDIGGSIGYAVLMEKIYGGGSDGGYQ